MTDTKCDELLAAIEKEFQSRRKKFIGAKSKMKYEMIENMLIVLRRERESGALQHSSVADLFHHKVDLADLGIQTPKQKKLYGASQYGVTTLKELLEFHRHPFKKRSLDFFKKPDSAQRILKEYYPLKERVLEFIDNARHRISKDKRKGDSSDKMNVLHHVQNAIKDANVTTLEEILNVKIYLYIPRKEYNLLRALQLNRESKNKGKDTQSFKKFCELFHLGEDPKFNEWLADSKLEVQIDKNGDYVQHR